MPKVSKGSASQVEQMGPMGEDRHEDLSGYTVDFMSFTQRGDLAPLLKGLEGDACQCPHWGIVVKGRLTFTYADGQDVVEAGRGLLRARRTHPCRGAGHRDDRVQPQRGSPRHHGGRHEERPSAGREGLTR